MGDELGPVDADAVVLLHGGGQTRQSWRGLQDALGARGVRTLSLDLRGHGESSYAPDGDYRLEAFAADIASVLRLLGGAPIVVGASLGGLAAIAALVEDGAPARALVVVDVTHKIRTDGAAKIRDFMLANPEGFASLDDAADAVATYLPHRTRPASHAGLERNLQRGADGRWRWRWDPNFINGNGEKSFRPLEPHMRALLPRLETPTLLIRGEASEIVTTEAADEFVALAPNARAVHLDGATHMVAGDDNDAFMVTIADFVLPRLQG